jgi:hypothetical protein
MGELRFALPRFSQHMPFRQENHFLREIVPLAVV